MILTIKVLMKRAIQRNTRILEKQADCIISAIDHVEYLKRVDYTFIYVVLIQTKSNLTSKL